MKTKIKNVCYTGIDARKNGNHTKTKMSLTF